MTSEAEFYTTEDEKNRSGVVSKITSSVAQMTLKDSGKSMKVVATFGPVEARVGPRGREQLRRERGGGVKSMKPSRVEHPVYLNIWIYSSDVELDRNVSLRDVMFGAKELTRMSIMTLLKRTVLSTEGSLNYYQVRACFKKDGNEEITSPEMVTFYPLIEDVKSTPASMWVEAPSYMPLSLEHETQKFSVFKDLCGYKLISAFPLPLFPITIHVEHPDIPQLIDSYKYEHVPPYVEIESERIFSGKADIMVNFVSRYGPPEDSLIEFDPKDSLDEIFRKLFAPQKDSKWFTGGEEKDIHQFLEGYTYSDKAFSINANAVKSAVNKAALAKLVYMIRQYYEMEKFTSMHNSRYFTAEWTFRTYAPYVVRAKYSIYSHDLPGGRIYDSYGGIYDSVNRAVKTIIRAVRAHRPAPSRYPDSHIAINRTKVLLNPVDYKSVDPNLKMLRNEVFVIWRPVHITERSMKAYLRKQDRVQGMGRGLEKENDISPTIADILSNFSAPSKVANRSVLHVRRSFHKSSLDNDKYILWSNTDNSKPAFPVEGDTNGGHVAFISIPKIETVERMNTFFENTGFLISGTNYNEELSLRQKMRENTAKEHLDKQASRFHPHLSLDIRFKGAKPSSSSRAKDFVVTDKSRNSDDEAIAPLFKFTLKMSFEEYVERQHNFDRLTSNQKPINLLLGELDSKLMSEENNHDVMKHVFFNDFTSGTADNLTPVEEPLPPLM